MGDLVGVERKQLALFPENRADWVAIRVTRKSLSLLDVVEQRHLALVEQNAEYGGYLRAWSHDMAVTGNTTADDVMAAQIMKTDAAEHGVDMIEAATLWSVVKAIRAVVGRRYGRSRKAMRALAAAARRGEGA